MCGYIRQMAIWNGAKSGVSRPLANGMKSNEQASKQPTKPVERWSHARGFGFDVAPLRAMIEKTRRF